MTETMVDINALLESPTLSPEAFQALRSAAFASPEDTNRFLAAVGELERQLESAGTPAVALKTGMCLLLLGRFSEALARLHHGTHNAARHYYTALTLMELRRFTEAREQLGKALEQGWDRGECERAAFEIDISTGETEKARARLKSLNEKSPEGLLARGRVAFADGDMDRALDHYDQALALEPSNPEVLFHKAYLLDLYGMDEEAIRLYEEASKHPYNYANAQINLAVLYEDHSDFDRAAACLRKVLAANPNHARAKLYLKDVDASAEMYIDERQLMDDERRSAVLDIPVTDFELSVRSRNCLKKMNIHTLGDLLRTTEAELLAYKNFGETSLREIKAMLYQKNLSLGQLSDQRTSPPVVMDDAEPVSTEELSETARMSVNELELSVRARKCLQRLGIEFVGDLIKHTETELLNSKNFGQTSLEEVKQRLAEIGVSLRNPAV